MEQRKVQLTGGSTFTISIPKDWARDHDISAGEEIVFHPDNGSLLLTHSASNEPTRGELDISGRDGDALMRGVMTMYVSGFDEIELTADQISPSQRRIIREATQSLVGLEVLEETVDTVLIQDLLDSAELSVHSAVERMHLIARSMLEDSIQALKDHDMDLATDVIARDDDVDRLWYVVSRIFRGTLRSPQMAREIGLSRENCFDYHSSARQLERIADHAAKISQLTLELDASIPEPVVDSLDSLCTAATDIIETAVEALFETEPGLGTELANDARTGVSEIDDQARVIDDQLRELDPTRARHLGLIVDSLSRSADYGGNIAETALQKAAPAPDV
ncbi:MAG: phosphate uptake regulator PhoU [Halodesulfurarchaeum sp.]|nr:phosphate uptake regulator PhoU [Halodesulfurarchaeum sp.]